MNITLRQMPMNLLILLEKKKVTRDDEWCRPSEKPQEGVSKEET